MSFSHEVTVQDLRPGDHIYANRALGTYTHHGIVVEINREDLLNSAVAHVQTNGQLVQMTTLKKFAEGHTIRRAVYGQENRGFKLRGSYPEQAIPPDQTVSMALEILLKQQQENEYHLFFNNCEHFATHCKTVSRNSKQVQVAESTLGGLATWGARKAVRSAVSTLTRPIVEASVSQAVQQGVSRKAAEEAAKKAIAPQLARSGAVVGAVVVEAGMLTYRFYKYNTQFDYSKAELWHETRKSAASATLTTGTLVGIILGFGPGGWALFGISVLVGLTSWGLTEWVASWKMFRLSDDTKKFSLCTKHSGIEVSAYSNTKTLEAARKKLHREQFRCHPDVARDTADVAKFQLLRALMEFLDGKISGEGSVPQASEPALLASKLAFRA